MNFLKTYRIKWIHKQKFLVKSDSEKCLKYKTRNKK